MGAAFLIQTFGPVALGLIFTLSGMLESKPLWLGRVGFLLAQIVLIYACGFGSIVGLGLVACVLLGFAVCAWAPGAGAMVRIAGTLAFFATYIVYWGFQKYLVPLVIAPAAAGGSPAWASAQGTASIVSIVGISYIGFKFIHLYVDYRAGEIADLEPLSFLSWLLFFPSIVAGPMQRYQDWIAQFGQRRLMFDEAIWGLRRILLGLTLKVVLADNIHGLTLPQMTPGTLVTASWGAIVLSALTYSLYLYLDFSGYCHIAIGTGVFWGIRLPENFNNPYISRNLAEFWNRWHITLSEILRDYLFYPLSFAVKRKPALRKLPIVATSLPPIITFALAGVWHGAGLNFLIYGLIHGVGLAYIAVRRARRPARADTGFWSTRSPIRHWASVAFTYVYVSFSFVFFSLPTEKLAILAGRLIGR